jgi:hypothetical protein
MFAVDILSSVLVIVNVHAEHNTKSMNQGELFPWDRLPNKEFVRSFGK